MNQAEQLRESRSRHLLQSYEAAVKQLRVFRELQPITTKESEVSNVFRVKIPTNAALPNRNPL